MLGLLALDPERIARFVTAILSILGGYLAGFTVVGVAAYFLDRWLAGGKTPAGLHKVLRYVGGVAGALLVALMVFGGLGNGSGTGGAGTGTAAGPGEGGPGTGPATAATSLSDTPPAVTPVPEPEKPTEETLQVTVLSGAAVRAARFYQVGDDPEPVDLAGVKERVRLKRVAPASLSVAIRLAPRTDRNNSGVLELEAWAREAGLRVVLPRKE